MHGTKWKKVTWKGYKMFDSKLHLYDIQEKAKLGDSEKTTDCYGVGLQRDEPVENKGF